MGPSSLRCFHAFVPYVLLLGFPTVVLAESPPSGRWFVEASVADIDSSATVSNFVIDSEKSGWSLGVGYAFNRHFALQASYHDLGDNHFATDCPPPVLCLIENIERVDIDGVSLSAIGTWPVSRLIDVYGKLGVMSWDTNFQRFPLDGSGEDLLYGIGVGIRLTPQWRLAVQYEKVEFDLESAALGLRYQF